MTLLPALALATPGISQQRISMKVKNVPLERVLKEVQRASGYYILYNVTDVNEVKAVSVELTDATVGEVLASALRDTPLRYLIEEETILITRGARQPQERVVINGVVKDASGQPVPGATIRVKDTNMGTSSRVDGNFRLDVTGMGDVVLLVTFIGMEPREIRYEGQALLEVTLKEQVSEIEEIVVTGIFMKARESYTGAVTVISGEELRRASNTSILAQVRNVDPAFNMLENNIYGSDPNRLPDINVRGSTSLTVGMRELQEESQAQSTSNLPLFIVDGFEVELQQVMDMDPALVESVTLLKDASATAMYGSRGANGVMVIATQRPERGKLRFTYKGDLNVEAPDLTSYNLLNAAEKLEYEVFAGIYGQGTPPVKQSWQEIYLSRLTEVMRGVDTYWLKYPVRVGVGNRHSARVDGGTESVRYAVNVSYNNIVGTMKGSLRETFSGSMFLRYDYGHLTFQNELTATFNTAGNSPYGAFSQYARLNPYWTPYDAEGNQKKLLQGSLALIRTPVGNPLYDATLPYRNDSKYEQLRNNLQVSWQVSPSLSLRGRFSVTRQTGRSDLYYSSKHSRFETDNYTGENYSLRGSYTYGTNYMTRYEADATVTYGTSFREKHAVYAGLNYRVSETKQETNTIKAEGYTAANMHVFGVANAYERYGSPSSTDAVSRSLGALLNLNYTYDKRYFVDFTAKMDASSQFGAKRRAAPFWSSGLGWNLHNETFLRDQSRINSLRLRLSYGTSGDQRFPSYQAMTIFHYQGTNYHSWTGYYMMALGNDQLKWQTTGQVNLGMDVELFNHRLRLRADAYNKDTRDVLADVNLPASSGFPNFKANIGKVRNRGVELAFNAWVWKGAKGKGSWMIAGSLIHNKNTVLKISNALDELNRKINDNENKNAVDRTSPSFLVKEGESLSTIYAVKSLGIDPSNGREVLVKKDGTKVYDYDWNAEDKVPCGVSDPKAMGTLNTTFRYGNLSCNLIFSYRLGADIYNQTLVDKVENVDPAWNVDARAFHDRWKKPGDNAKFKGVAYYKLSTSASSRFVMREYMMDCRSMSISYDWQGQWLRAATGLERLTVAAFTEDLFRFSTIKRERGTSYPFAHRFSLSLSALF
jgi:TonB-linked SusC/RagA family outer membrane protein